MLLSFPRFGSTVAVAALACLGTVLVPLSPASAGPGPSWFHDPVSASERRAEVPVPAHPERFSGGRVRDTVATYRARSGSLAVPIGWADGHRMRKGQAVVIQGRSAFGYNSGAPTRSARAAVRGLADSLTGVTSVKCEGYADFGGAPGFEGALSRERARKVCAIIGRSTVGVSTKAVAFGISRPVVLGGNHADRRTNRRVVIKVTGSATAPQSTVPSAPVLTDLWTADTVLGAVFDESTDDGGSPILRYEYSVDGGAWTDGGPNLHPEWDGEYYFEIPGLTPGTEYDVRVRAVNATGPSLPSNTFTASTTGGVTATVPDAPVPASTSGVTSTTAVVTFPVPDDGGSAILGYEYSLDNGVTWETVGDDVTPGGDYDAELTGLTAETGYVVVFRAVNAIGNSQPSDQWEFTTAADAATEPGAPTITGGSAYWVDVPGPSDPAFTDVTFTAPASDGGDVITGYELSYDGGAWTAISYTGTDPYMTSVENVNCSGSHTYEIRAVNSIGAGTASASLSVDAFCD